MKRSRDDGTRENTHGERLKDEMIRETKKYETNKQSQKETERKLFRQRGQRGK